MDNHLLSETDEAIIRAVHTYRYMRQDDISLLIRNGRANSRLRARLSRLCGGADKVPGKTLYRLPLPTFTPAIRRVSIHWV